MLPLLVIVGLGLFLAVVWWWERCDRRRDG